MKTAEYLTLTAIALAAALWASAELQELLIEVLNQIAQMINPQ